MSHAERRAPDVGDEEHDRARQSHLEQFTAEEQPDHGQSAERGQHERRAAVTEKQDRYRGDCDRPDKHLDGRVNLALIDQRHEEHKQDLPEKNDAAVLDERVAGEERFHGERLPRDLRNPT